MKERIKNILKYLGVYYFLQGSFRQSLFAIKRISTRIKYSKFKGPGFECNCCGSQYTRFAPDYPSSKNARAITENEVVGGYGKNILCPACLSTARERLVIAILKSRIKVVSKKILHLSPEKNIYQFIKKDNEIIATDIQPAFYKRIDRLIRQEDATHLSFSNNSFDLVIGNHIMEHIPDDSKAMSEIYRVLKPGGQAILQIPYSNKIAITIEEPGINNPKRQSVLFGQKDHVRIYQLQDYLGRLRKCGFEVFLIEYKDLSAYYKNAIQVNEGFICISK